MQSKTLLVILSVFFILSSLAGCSGGVDDLNGTRWQLVGWTLSSLYPGDFTITAEFSEGRISGNSGVNSYGGNYRLDSSAAFSVGELLSTAMAGTETAMRAESTYQTLLSQARSYALVNDNLILYDEAGNESLIFEVQTSPQETQTPAIEATTSLNAVLISTMVASGPIIEITFDRKTCTMSGLTQIPKGKMVIKYTNLSDKMSAPGVARNYPGYTYEDVLEVIGTPGAEIPDNIDWIALIGSKRSVSESESVSYREYDLSIEAEYHIVVEDFTDHIWVCGPFRVVQP